MLSGKGMFLRLDYLGEEGNGRRLVVLIMEWIGLGMGVSG
jgi:hypothetical protein